MAFLLTIDCRWFLQVAKPICARPFFIVCHCVSQGRFRTQGDRNTFPKLGIGWSWFSAVVGAFSMAFVGGILWQSWVCIASFKRYSPTPSCWRGHRCWRFCTRRVRPCFCSSAFHLRQGTWRCGNHVLHAISMPQAISCQPIWFVSFSIVSALQGGRLGDDDALYPLFSSCSSRPLQVTGGSPTAVLRRSSQAWECLCNSPAGFLGRFYVHKGHCGLGRNN